jgi:membrane protein
MALPTTASSTLTGGRRSRLERWIDLKLPISWFELAKRTVKEVLEDDCLGLSAQLAYYFFLALFPALLALVAIASYLPGETIAGLIAQAQAVLPEEVTQILRDQLSKISEQGHADLLTVGFLGALWSSSAAIVAIVGAMNKAYDVEETRPWWKVRAIAIGLTMGLAVFILGAFAILVAGQPVVEWLAGPAAGWVGPLYAVLQWPLAFVLVVFAVAWVQDVAPNVDLPWTFLTPGSLVATLLWLAISAGFKFYVANFANYTETYGAIGGVIVLLLWFYMTGFAILVGAEMNSEIAHAKIGQPAPQG